MLGVNDTFEDGVREADLVVVADAVALIDAFGVGLDEEDGIVLIDTFDDSDGDATDDGVVVIDAFGDMLGVAVALLDSVGVLDLEAVGDSLDDGLDDVMLFVAFVDGVVVMLGVDEIFDDGVDEDTGVILTELFVVADALTLGDKVVEAFDDGEPLSVRLAVAVMLAFDDGLGTTETVLDALIEGDLVRVADALGDVVADALGELETDMIS